VTDDDLDFSGFQAERKVDVPPPPMKKASMAPAKTAGSDKKGKKSKKKKSGTGKPSPAKPKAKETVPAKPRAEPVKPEPAAPPTPSAPIPKPGRKKRVNVSLPVGLSQRFTERAAEEDRYLTDMVLDAYRNHYAAMRDEYDADRGDVDLPFRPRRRKAVAGRVTHMLYLAAPEAAVIDGSAVEIGLSRSELVSQLLEKELAG
jgi:hypothetical protein